jgi:nucleotide-binding universal stress UspA family protein
VPLPSPERFERIGVAFDGSKVAYWALIVATRLAQEAGARLVALAGGRTTARADTLLQVARLSLDPGAESREPHPLGLASAGATAEQRGRLARTVCPDH